MQGIPVGHCFECTETPENALFVNPLCTMSQGVPPLLKCVRVQDVLLSVQWCSAYRTDLEGLRPGEHISSSCIFTVHDE